MPPPHEIHDSIDGPKVVDQEIIVVHLQLEFLFHVHHELHREQGVDKSEVEYVVVILKFVVLDMDGHEGLHLSADFIGIQVRTLLEENLVNAKTRRPIRRKSIGRRRTLAVVTVVFHLETAPSRSKKSRISTGPAELVHGADVFITATSRSPRGRIPSCLNSLGVHGALLSTS